MTRNETHQPRRDASGETPTKGERQRIAKRMARAGLCSRRDAEAWITGGRVKVNGELLSSPARDVGPEDVILVDDEPIPTAEKTRLFMFHKPRGLVTSDHDPEGRETVADFLRENWPEGPRVVTIGRLDINTEGLLLLTNDGGLARMLELPETGWLRRYRVRAKGTTDQAALDALADGIEIDGIDYAGIDAKLDRIQGSNCWLTMGLREGKNREIKRVLEHIGLEVNRLIRLSFGPFQLLDLPDGAVEEVRTRVLRDQLGESLAAAAGVDLVEKDGAPPMPAPAPKIVRRDGERPRGRQVAEPRDMPDREAALDPDRRLSRPKGPRRHVSTLRAGNATVALDGPRKRVERTSTRDRHDRVVAVERVMTRERPARPSEARPKGSRPGATRSGGKGGVSPSADAKRTRIARSGGGERANQGGTGRRESGRGAPGPRDFDRRDKPDAAFRRKPSFASAERREGGRPRADDGQRAPSRFSRQNEGRDEEMGGRRARGASGDRLLRKGGSFDERPRGPPAGPGERQGRQERARPNEGPGRDERQGRSAQHVRKPGSRGGEEPRRKPGSTFRERPKGPHPPRSGRPTGDRPRPRPVGAPRSKPPRGAPREGPRGKPKR